MRRTLVTLLAVIAAVVGWWGLYEFTDQRMVEPSAYPLLFALLFLATTATLIPPAAFLNRRFAPEVTARDPWRSLRHSAWGGICVTSWAWLQMERYFNLGYALVTVMIFVAIEVLIARLRTET